MRLYAPAFLRRVWIVLLCAVIGAGVAYILSVSGRPQYTGQTLVLVSQRDAGNWVAQSGVYPVPAIATWESAAQIEVAPIGELVNSAISTLDLSLNPSDVLEHTLFEVDPLTKVITVSVDEDDPELARTLSRAVAEAFVAWAQGTERQRLESFVTTLSEKRQAVEGQMAAAQRLGVSSAELGELERQLETTTEWLEQITTLELVGTLQASYETKAVTPSLLGAHEGRGLAGAAVGLVLGIGIAMIGARSDSAVRSRERASEVVMGLGADVEVLPSSHGRVPKILDEATGVLRSWLVRNGAAAEAARVVVTGVGTSCEAEDIAFEVARSLAAAGRRVRVVLLHEPSQRLERELQHPAGPGLAEVLADRAGIEDLASSTSVAGLDVVHLGQGGAYPEDLIASKALPLAMASLAEHMDCLVLSAGGNLQPHQLDQLLQNASAAIYILRMGRATEDELAEAVSGAAERHVPRVCVMLTPASGLSHRGRDPRSQASTAEG
jgi:capsular polysaccharide biosynthesis protein